MAAVDVLNVLIVLGIEDVTVLRLLVVVGK